MKRKIHSVLRSRTGASITFALLLFLVCAVVGALVLTAGSAAAGRISNLAQSDQRYYSVTSAADLLAEELSEKTVTITRERVITTEASTSYKVNLGGSSVVSKDGDTVENSSVEYTTTLNGSNTVENSCAPYPIPADVSYEGGTLTAESFLDTIAVNLLFNNNVCNTDEAMNQAMKNGAEQSGTLRLIHAGSSGEDSTVGLVDPISMSVECDYVVQPDGTIILTLTNITTDEDGNYTKKSGETYTLRMKLSPNINETETESAETLSTDRTYTDSGFTETVKTKTTLTKTSVVTWTVSGVEKVVSEAVSQPEGTDAPGETETIGGD